MTWSWNTRTTLLTVRQMGHVIVRERRQATLASGSGVPCTQRVNTTTNVIGRVSDQRFHVVSITTSAVEMKYHNLYEGLRINLRNLGGSQSVQYTNHSTPPSTHDSRFRGMATPPASGVSCIVLNHPRVSNSSARFIRTIFNQVPPVWIVRVSRE